MTQHMYVHRKLKNIIITEIKVQIMNNQAVTVDLFNYTKLHLNTSFINSDLNPNRFSYYDMENSFEQISYEQQVLRQPSCINKNRLELNDGV